jgi:hypothetical protein
MTSVQAICLITLTALTAIPISGCTAPDGQTMVDRDRARLLEIQRLRKIQDNFAR